MERRMRPMEIPINIEFAVKIFVGRKPVIIKLLIIKDMGKKEKAVRKYFAGL
tara:strand:- start:236 stop:391 length:156 start_codon:yes stop_codon:yes gene_type:complete